MSASNLSNNSSIQDKIMMTPITMKLMALSINTAKRAGTIIRDIMKTGNLGIIEKGHNDPQTEADRSAQKCIVASISKEFPKIKIIGEEGGLNNSNIPNEWLENDFDSTFLNTQSCPDNLINVQEEDIVVWVDPLDGTTEYTQGFLDRVTVLIGIAIKNSAIGGIIHQPYYKNSNGDLGRTIWGLKGLGIGGGGFEPKEPPKNEFIITTTRTHSSQEVQNALNALHPTKVLRVGGAGFKVLQLLDGIAHAYVFASPGCKKWDICAPEAVLEAYGGTLTDIIGRHYEYHKTVEFQNKSGVLATNKGISHQSIVDKIPDDIKNTLRN